MRRRTYRKPAGEVAYQRQVRDEINEDAPKGVDLSLKTAIIRPVSKKLATRVILQYEWLGTMSNTRHHYGVFFGAYCAGVTCFAQGTGTGGTNTPAFFGVSPQDLLVLARGACVSWAPAGANSKLISWSCRLLAKANIGKLVVAYADTDAGEIGTVYQASNWTYIGKGGATTQYVSPRGRRAYDRKLISNRARQAGVSWRHQRDHFLSLGWREQRTNPKHRYVQILNSRDRALALRIARLRKHYPTRAGSIGSDAPVSHAGKGGASPTPALHLAPNG